MATDPERERLTEVYSPWPMARSRKLRKVEASLTGVARQVLHDEIVRRGFDYLLSDQDKPQDETAEPEPMVTICSFGDIMQAWLAKSNLDSAGIECRLVDDNDDNMVRLYWGSVNVLGGVKLQVKPEDAEVALELLEQRVPEQPGEDNPERQEVR